MQKVFGKVNKRGYLIKKRFPTFPNAKFSEGGMEATACLTINESLRMKLKWQGTCWIQRDNLEENMDKMSFVHLE